MRLCKPGEVFLCLAFGPFSITAAPMQTAEDSVNWLFMKKEQVFVSWLRFRISLFKKRTGERRGDSMS